MQKGMQCPRIDGLLAEDPCALHQAVATGAQYMSIPIRELGHAIQLYDLLNYFPIQQYALLTHNSMLSYPETLLQRTAVGSAPYVLIVAGSPFRCTPAMVVVPVHGANEFIGVRLGSVQELSLIHISEPTRPY